ncbi:MAG: hypothetical protein ACQGVK_08190 [Myxococcota bacterium]
MPLLARVPVSALFALALLGLAGASTQAVAFSSTVAFGASGVEFQVPGLMNGVSLETNGGAGFASVSGNFGETYVGQNPNTAQSVEWEVDGSGFASLASGVLRAEAFAQDNRNADANDWSFAVLSGYEETIELTGPATNGFYEVTLEITLDPFDATPNPLAPSFVWEARADVDLSVVASSGDASGDFDASLLGWLDYRCPAFDAPAPDCDPFFGFQRPPFEDSATFLIPESDPFFTISHDLRVSVTSAHADVSNSSELRIILADGVDFESESGLLLSAVPEPGAALLLAAAGALWIGIQRRS